MAERYLISNGSNNKIEIVVNMYYLMCWKHKYLALVLFWRVFCLKAFLRFLDYGTLRKERLVNNKFMFVMLLCKQNLKIDTFFIRKINLTFDRFKSSGTVIFFKVKFKNVWWIGTIIFHVKEQTITISVFPTTYKALRTLPQNIQPTPKATARISPIH